MNHLRAMARMHYDPAYAVNRGAVHTSPYFPTMHRAPLSYGYGGRMPVVELIVPMCCSKCQEKIRENMLELRGVQTVFADLQAQRVVVTGFVDPIKVLKKAKKVKRDSVLYTGAAAAAAASSYGGSEYFAPGSNKYRRSSEYRPSLYRTSSQELRRPSLYRSSSLEYTRPPGYRSLFNQYTPSHGQSFVHRPMFESSYIDPYSHDINHPHYSKHIDSEYY